MTKSYQPSLIFSQEIGSSGGSLVMYAGRKVEEAEVDELFDHPESIAGSFFRGGQVLRQGLT